MTTAGITIVLQQMPGGPPIVHHIVMGDIPLELAANACRAIADKIDRERIQAEVEAERETEDVTEPEL